MKLIKWSIVALVAMQASLANAAYIPSTSLRSSNALPHRALSPTCENSACQTRFTPASAAAAQSALKSGLGSILKLQAKLLKASKGEKSPKKLKKLQKLQNQIAQQKAALNSKIDQLAERYQFSAADRSMISRIQSETLSKNTISLDRLAASRGTAMAFRTTQSSISSSAGKVVVSVLKNGLIQIAITAAVVKVMDNNNDNNTVSSR